MRVLGRAVLVIAIGLIANCTTAPGTVVDTDTLLSEVARRILVRNQDEYHSAMRTARPGDAIVLANGIWRDFDLVLDAEGTEEAPVYLLAEEPGSVFLSGQSSLRLGGEYLIVSGLVFREGYTPLNEVVSFRIDSNRLAYNSRITNSVIENYNNPDRNQRDTWVAMYGQNNQFDHNHLSGKLNSGPTMVVRLNSENSQNNNHRINNNYFGPRAIFGSNGGETLRIGTSHYSLKTSGTLVDSNYFDRCSGEVEIVSNKSVGNIYRGNTFYQSRGTLTLRHGNETLVEGNLFEGNGAPYTGGVRVINAKQTVRNNLFRNLTGSRFSAALVVMNGVPNSPINRYHQVDGAEIVSNTFDQVSAIELGEGADSERSAAPINSVFGNNLVIGSGEETPFNLYDEMDGISFSDNLTNLTPPPELASGFNLLGDGVAVRGSVGAQGEFGVAKSETGVSWFPKPDERSPFKGGRVTKLSPGENQIFDAISNASPGDEIVLAPGSYNEAKTISLRFPVTIRAEEPDTVELSFERRNLFLLSANGSLRLMGLKVTGSAAPDNVGNSFITSATRGGPGNHVLELSEMAFEDFVINRAFSIVSAAKGTFFDRVEVTNSTFENVSGVPFKFDAETDDFGIYNVEYLIIKNSKFSNVNDSVASIYRGGRDESTFGPHAFISDSVFRNVGADGEPLALLHGAQNIRIERNTIDHAKPMRFVITTGIPEVVHSENKGVDGSIISALVTEDLRK